MIGNTRQASYILIGMLLGYAITNNVKGAFIGGLIGFGLSMGRRFV